MYVLKLQKSQIKTLGFGSIYKKCTEKNESWAIRNTSVASCAGVAVVVRLVENITWEWITDFFFV